MGAVSKSIKFVVVLWMPVTQAKERSSVVGVVNRTLKTMPPAILEILRCRGMQRQVQGQPKSLRIAGEPN